MNSRYEIKEKIGQGGLGEVYSALDTQLQRDVAVKRMIAGPETSPDDLLKEAKVLSALQHPNILTVFDVGKDEKGAFVVMELLRGETLDEVITRGALTFEDFRQVAVQTLEGLTAAQSLGLVHRDLKPGNMMLIWHASGKFQLKILDFGLAKFSAGPSKQTEDQEAGVLGSIFYMSPEQFERQPLDARSDLYALGCIFYHSLSGRVPFNGDTSPAVMASHLRHLVTPLHDIRPDLPHWVCDWVMWFINRKSEDRPDNAKIALDAFLEQAVAYDMAMQSGTMAAAYGQGAVTQPMTAEGSRGPSTPTPPRAPAMSSARPSSNTPSAHVNAVLQEDDDIPVWKQPWVLFAIPTLVTLIAGFFIWKMLANKKNESSSDGPVHSGSQLSFPDDPPAKK
jgi:serine/threonine protein kinase